MSGRGIERLIARHDVENEEAMRYVEDRLRTIGVIRALEAKGDYATAIKQYSQVAQWNFNYRDVQARIKALRAAAKPQA